VTLYVHVSVHICVTLMYSRWSSSSDQTEQRRAGCAPCAAREAASDVFLDGLNNVCLKRLLGPQLPNFPLSSTLTCIFSSFVREEEEGVSTFTKATCCLLSLAVTGNGKRSLKCLIWIQAQTFTAIETAGERNLLQLLSTAASFLSLLIICPFLDHAVLFNTLNFMRTSHLTEFYF